MLAAAPGAGGPSAASRFEASAEASEKAIPPGLEVALDDELEALTLGEPPPPGYPRERCEDVFVYIVTVAEGAPLRSAASIGIGKKGPARLRRPGERLGDFRVLAITDDWTGLNPDVWLEREGSVCHAELAGNPTRVHAPLQKRKPAAPKKRRKRKR